MDWLDALQWPGMVLSILAAWLVASSSEGRRRTGFWVFLASNVCWVVWGWYTGAWALVGLQLGLALMNVRGVRRNERQGRQPSEQPIEEMSARP